MSIVQYDKDKVFPGKKIRQASKQPIKKDSGSLQSRFLSFTQTYIVRVASAWTEPLCVVPMEPEGAWEINTNMKLRLPTVPWIIKSFFSLNPGISCLLPTPRRLQKAKFSDPSVLNELFLSSWVWGTDWVSALWKIIPQSARNQSINLRRRKISDHTMHTAHYLSQSPRSSCFLLLFMYMSPSHPTINSLRRNIQFIPEWTGEISTGVKK